MADNHQSLLGWLRHHYGALHPGSRLNRHLAHPDHGTGEMDAGEEVDGAAVVAGGDMPEVLELVDEALDAIAQFVCLLVMRDVDVARALGGDHRFGASFGNALTQGIAVIGLVADDGASLEVGQQGGRPGDVMRLTASQEEAQGAALRIGEDMNFGRQSSSGTPQSLILAPPFRWRLADGREPRWCRA